MKRATKITIEIVLENDTFYPQPEPEIIHILRGLISRLEQVAVDDLGRIADSNGNTVGHVTCDH